ncbi:related to monocarboxylate transporter [Cephalotrichum gorgonifer]|uniref:Related to monocarboxylate transporter n=1 Tax=Cephalotrichum gorgonifer TaxID=2041049 RepID=A0AAE8MR29_9PEZI|nr:related to monocarboxylate transporter [Cephalotrichum gorgonifer]
MSRMRMEPHKGVDETAVEMKSQTPSGSRSNSDGNGTGDNSGALAAIPDLVLARPATPTEEDNITYPDGGTRAWAVVLGSAINMAATYGLMTGVGLFQVYWKEHQLKEYSPTDIAWIISVFGFLDIFAAGPAGVLFDRWGARRLLFPAGAVYFASFVGLAFSTKYEQFMGCFIVAGVSASFITTIAAAVINHWFLRRKGLAMGLATMGSGIGGIFFSVVLKPLFERLSWQQGILVLSCIVCAAVTTGALCTKARIPPRTDKFFDFSCFKSLRFLLTTLSVSGFELVLFASWGIIPTYAEAAGLGNKFYLMLALNIGSTLGRIIPGYLADKMGSFNVTLAMSLFTLFTMLGIWLPAGNSSEVALYAVSTCLGFGTGSFVATSATCLGHLCDTRDSGKYFGSCYTVVSLATLVSNPICQAILDSSERHGQSRLVWFLATVLAVSTLSCATVRWILLGYRWRWLFKV